MISGAKKKAKKKKKKKQQDEGPPEAEDLLEGLQSGDGCWTNHLLSNSILGCSNFDSPLEVHRQIGSLGSLL